MITPNAAMAVQDNLMDGMAKLGLPFSPERLAIFRCNSSRRCYSNHCPVCSATVNMELLDLDRSDLAFNCSWRRQVYVLRDFTTSADNPMRVDFGHIRKTLQKALDGWVESARRLDGAHVRGWACIATYGLVQDLGSKGGRDQVVVVEIAFTGGDTDADYDIHESLQVIAEETSNVPLLDDDEFRLAPNQGLLYGYTKRDLRKPDRPKVIYNRRDLASMHLNYAKSPDERRLLTRGLTNMGGDFVLTDIVCFNEDAIPII